MKAWQAFLLLGGMGRIVGNHQEKRLKKIDREIAGLEEQIEELKKEAEEIRSKQKPPTTLSRDAQSPERSAKT